MIFQSIILYNFVFPQFIFLDIQEAWWQIDEPGTVSHVKIIFFSFVTIIIFKDLKLQ